MSPTDLRPDPEARLRDAPEPWASTSMPSPRGTPPFHMTEMIEAEPALAERLLERLGEPDGAAARLAAEIRGAAERGAPILVTGCGTSEHGAQAFVEILREALWAIGLPASHGRTGTPVALQALEAFQEDELGGPGAVVVGISHEGATWATNRSLQRARDARARVAVVTVSDRSPAAALADVVVTTGELDESWCHTVGYVSPILAATAVAGHLTGRPIPGRAARSALAAGLDPAELRRTESFAAAIADADRIVVTGSGGDRIAARELALKLEEGTHLPAVMRDLETVLHGHLAGMDARTALVLVLADTSPDPEARARRATDVLRAVSEIGIRAGAIMAARYARVIDPALTPAGRLVVPATSALPAAVATLLGSAVPLQLLTERLARARGVDPDPIRRDQGAWLRAAEAAEPAG
jgi:glutamine---fructose-6-phosphate transaminase (isomerizing)